MMQPAAVIRLARLVLLSTLIPCSASASTWTAFGPEVVVRRTGKPTPVIRTFSVLNPDAVYVLQVEGTSAGKPPRGALEIVLNNRRVTLGPASSSLPVAGWPVRLNRTNQLVMELRGAPGELVSVKIVGVDTDPPTSSGTIAPAAVASTCSAQMTTT